jgi:cation diffusion facilitator family transporter
MVANRRSARHADRERPLGYGREAYVWSLLAAVGLFVVGGTVSVWRGVSELLDDRPADEHYLVAYVVLAIALVMEGTSFLQAVRQLRTDAHAMDREVLEYAMRTSDPTVRAVFAEDSAALIGIAVAGTGIGLHQLTGVAAWDAAGSILVGLLLGVVAVLLIDRNRRFLTGEPGTPRLRDAVVAGLEAFDEVESVRFIRLEFVGPRQLFVVASVDLVGDQIESHIAHTLRKLERRLEANPNIVDAVLTVAEPADLDDVVSPR